jgi:hypothetical protein
MGTRETWVHVQRHVRTIGGTKNCGDGDIFEFLKLFWLNMRSTAASVESPMTANRNKSGQIFVQSEPIDRRARFEPVVGEFRKRPEFYGLLSLIPSCTCVTFSLFFCMRLLSSCGWSNPVHGC